MSFWHQLRCVLASLAGGSQERRSRGCCAPSGRRVVLEALEDRRLLSVVQADGALYDFGDAPAPYATTLVSDGARHVATGPMLGGVRDTEADGTPSVGADSDDTTGAADEDGVVFGAIQVGQLDASVTVSVQNAPSGAKLDAWIDFNGDGDWADVGEQIFNSTAVSAGVNAINFSVPGDGKCLERAFTRFRISTVGGLAYDGLAEDGEVEDHVVSIGLGAPVLAAGPAVAEGTENTILWSNVNGADAFFAEYDNNADFSSPEGNSGWIADTAFTFGGLIAGQEYFYRVKARQLTSGSSGSWSQTTQVDFSSNTLTDTNATMQPGDVTLASTGERDVLWDLTHGVPSNHQPSGYYSDLVSQLANSGYIVTTTSAGLANLDLSGYEAIVVCVGSAWDTPYTAAEVAAVQAFVENGGGLLVMGGSPWAPNENVNPIAQTFGSTLGVSFVDSLGYYVSNFASHPIFDGVSEICRLNGGEVTASSPSALVALLSDKGVAAAAEFGSGRAVMLGSMEPWTNGDLYWSDNLEFADNTFAWLCPGNRYVDSGTVVSSVITPASLHEWGTLAFGKTTLANTTVAVDVLPVTGFTPIPGYEDVSSVVDLSGIAETAIRLRASLATTDTDITPALHDWSVNWLETPHVYCESDWSSLQVALDFGDAPAPYPTLSADDGARHMAMGPTLGPTRDSESDGQPSATSLGDDDDGSNDEDGVVFGTIQVGQLDASVTVYVQDAPADAKLDAWIDFNADGSWGGPGEQVANTVAVVEGDNTIQFDVPSWAVSGDTYARLRLSTAGSLAPSSGASDGEVEDHLVTILPPRTSSGAFGSRQIITESADYATSVFAADMDGDGDMDVLSASYADDKIAWYENDGSQEFASHTIFSSADEASCVYAADVDGDGDTDVLSASAGDNAIRWYENDGAGNFAAHNVASLAHAALSVSAADVDGDGDLDVLSGSGWGSHSPAPGGQIHWYENDGSHGFTAHTIATLPYPAESVLAADVDGDGNLDVVSGPSGENSIAWYKNDGTETFTAHTITALAERARSVFATDVDGDADMDILSASMNDNTIAWYENDGDEGFTRHTITTLARTAESVFAADADGDGDVDVFSASWSGDQIVWYENDGFADFTRHVISSSASGASSVFPADVDGDGDLDVLSASHDDRIAWYENGPSGFTVNEPGGVTIVQESGTTDTFTVVLDEIPTPQVVITVTSADTGEATVDKASLTFTQADWNIPQTVMVTGVEDAVADGDQTTRITLSVDDMDSDDIFDGLNDQHVFAITVGGGIPTDFGDAPSSYPTTLDSNGARHSASGPTLGFARDWEDNGTPSADADSDDNNATIDDEEGVAFGSFQVGQTDAVVTVNVQNAPAGARLDAWIDFNADGSWSGPGEQIAVGRVVVEGDNLVQFDVPSWSVSGETYARFRLSTIGKLAPSGPAEDGEVEDYQVTIDPPSPSSAVFGPRQILADTWSVTAFSVRGADLNGDGDEDVLSAWSGKIAWYENDGLGGFLTQHVIGPTWYGSYSVCAADLDGDGDLDVLSASAYANRLDWYENTGNAASFAHHAITTAANTPYSVFAADLDGDGDLDVLFGASKKVAWYENNGSGTFGVEHLITTDVYRTESVFAADLDGDGDLDVLSASVHYGEIAWYQNDGGGTFGSQQIITSAAVGAMSVFGADLDDDGDVDVLSASSEDDKIAWYENMGGGIFGIQQVITTDADGAFEAIAADMDGDGDLDVLSASRLDKKIAWHENAGNGSFSTHHTVVTEEMLTCMFPADFDGDGDQDVVSGTRYGGIDWYENTAETAFSGPQILETDREDPYSVFVVDMDADGDQDALVAYSNMIAWCDNSGDGSSDTMHVVTRSASGGNSVFAADLDGDGDMDVLAAISYGTIAWYENTGTGGFGTERILTTDAEYANAVFAADLDGDGDLDVLSASRDDDKIAWYENIGNGTFTSHTITTLANGASSVFAADLDGDGDLDVFCDSGWYENTGGGVFSTQQIVGVGGKLAADLDGDGDLDVLSASFRSIGWYENAGNGVFGVQQVITTDVRRVESLYAADLDGDGDLDVLSASFSDHKIAWYENDGSGSFGPQHVITTGAEGARSVFAADWDGDGDLDVLTASHYEFLIAWHENLALDYGDAPDMDTGTGAGDYNTLESDSGPSHVIVAGLFIGSTVDVDDGTLQNATADADDTDQLPDDEDGLSDPATDLAFILGSQPTVAVTVTNTTGSEATLSGWIDYNNDGVFDNTTERAQAIVADGTTGGTVTLAFPLLLTEYTGTTYARFRLSTDAAGNEPTGRASDGEVEDYTATISGIPGIDLFGMGFDAAPDNLSESGGTATVAFLLRNLGDTASGPFDVQFYLSDDAVIDPATDILLNLAASDTSYDALEPEAYHVAGLVSAGRHDGVVTLSIPLPDPFGTDNEYFLGMFVDADGDVVEANEANNRNQGQDLDLDNVEYTVGPLDHFEWDVVASPQARTVPFSAQVRATDSYGWTITSFNDTVDLSGWIAQGTSSTIVITECDPGSPDFIEIQNVSQGAIDTSGWTVAVSAGYSNINSVNTTYWSLPASMLANQVLYKTDTSADNYWGSNIYWGSTNNGWAIILDDSGGVVDFVAWGWTASQIAEMNATIAGHNVTIDSEFTSDGISLSGTGSIQRQGDLDNNDATDFTWLASSKGTQDAGLTVPFASPVSVVPSSATFVAGVWTGDVTVLEVAGDMHLRADDGSGHVGITSTFDVVPGPADFDFGDAPDLGYATLLASDGARHYPAGPTLGSVRDWENDGVPTSDADGDDASGTLDDEDGVTVAPLLAPGITDTKLTVEASAESFLNAWIDFNADGDWDDPGEQMAVDAPLNAGSNGLSLNVPISAVPGLTYARFRLTSYDTGGTLQPTGPADDGEVEDYAWAIENIPPTADVGGPYTVAEGGVVQLDASGSTDPGSDALTYEWDLDGDGEYDDATGVTPDFSAVGLDGPATVTVGLRVTDDDGGSDTASVDVTVTNVAPTADTGGPYTVVEGGTVQLDASGSTDPGSDALTYEWDLDGDGAYDDATGVTPDFSAVGLDGPATVTVGLRVTDDDGGSDTASVDVTVTNAPPTANVGGPYTVIEGEAVQLDASGSTDPGSDALTYEWDLDGDGEYDDATGGTPDFSAVGLDGPAVVAIGLRVSDDDGASDTASVDITVTNAAPTADAGGPYTVVEGGTVQLDAGGSTDPGSDTLTYEWDLDGDGEYDDATGATPDFLAVGLDGPAVVTVGLRVSDDDGRSDTASVDVTVTNAAPTADAGGPYTVVEGGTVQLDSGGSTDSGSDSLTYEWDLDGDGEYDDATGVTPDFSAVGLDGPATVTVGLRVSDDDGGSDTASVDVTITNAAPTADAGGAYTVVEGGAVQLNAGGSTDPGGDALTYEWDFDGDGEYDDATGVTPDFSAVGLDGPATVTVGLRVTDDDGGSDTAGVDVTVTNAPPTADAGGSYSVVEGGTVQLDASGSTDPGSDSLTYQWDLNGDGEYDDATGMTPDFSAVGLDGPATVTVGLRVSDDDGGSDTAGVDVTVTNSPPTADTGGSYSVVEGGTVQLDASGSTDPGGDALTYEWDLDGDGEYDDATGMTPDFSAVGLDGPAVVTVGLRVSDDDGASDTASVDVSVTNEAPTADLRGPYTVVEGGTVQLDAGGSTDPGSDTLTYEWDLDGDGEYDDATGVTPDFSAVGLDGPATVTVGLRVSDDDGGSDTVSVDVTVTNAAPTANVGGPYTVVEGGTVQLDGGGSTDPGGDALTYDWDLDGDGEYDDATGATPDFSAVGLDGPATVTVGLRVTDDDGASDTAGVDVSVTNAAPTADAGGPYTVVEGGTVQLDAGGSTDSGNDTLTYEWDLDGDGEYDDATGATPDFSAVGLDGPATVTVGLRVTDDDGASDTASVDVTVTRPEPIGLGAVDFTQLSSVSLTDGYVWYELTAVRNGQLTAIASAVSGSATATLYDSSKTVLTVSGDMNGAERLDHWMQAGETYFVRIAGDSSDVGLTLANLVNTAGTEVQVFGTDGADAFEFAPTGSYVVTINGIEYHFNEAEYETIVFDGQAGDDTATLTGGPDLEVARFYPDHGTFGENGFLVTVDNVAAITAHGGGGPDEAYLFDSPGDDEFVSRRGYGKLSGEGFVLETFDFMFNYGYATTADGGTDTARMEDTPEADKFKFDWPKPGQFFGKMYGGGQYYNRAKYFEQIDAVMTDGKDIVRLFDSEGDDTFYGQKDESRLVGTGFDVSVTGYDSLIAFASKGLDIAHLEDSADNDTTRARPHKIMLWGGEDDDPTYEITARRFDEYHFEAKHGGYDRAKLHDTALSDHVYAAGESARLSTVGAELDLLYEVVAFEWVKLYGSDNSNQDTLEKEDPLDFELVYDAGEWGEEV